MAKEQTAAERLADLHSREGGHGWQYAVVWRYARKTDPETQLGPPADDIVGWEVNTDLGEHGQRVTVPGWSDGSVVVQATHWRRKYSGMGNGHHDRKIHRRVTWDGDPRADEG